MDRPQSLFARLVLAAPLGVMAVVALVSAGCSSTPAAVRQAQNRVETLQNIEADLVRGRSQTDAMLDALDRVITAGQTSADPTEAFTEFTRAYEATEDSQERVGGRLADLRRNTERYLQEWQSDTEAIQNALLQEQSLRRQEQASEAMQRLNAAGERLEAAYAPFMQDLQDARLYLRRNLTPQGITAVAGVLREAREGGAEVRKAYDEMLVETNRLRTMFAPAG